jgi:hypothetical protein
MVLLAVAIEVLRPGTTSSTIHVTLPQPRARESGQTVSGRPGRFR